MEGFWTVEFGSSAGDYSGGVLFFNDGKIAGGDAGYYYVGDYQMTGESSFTATLHLKPFIKEAVSVFKTRRQELTLNLEGTIKDLNHATAQGKSKGIPDLRIGMKLERREEAVAA
jgi:hypothetical protein